MPRSPVQCIERGEARYHEWRPLRGTGTLEVICIYCLQKESVEDGRELMEAHMKWDRERPRGGATGPLPRG